MNGLDGAVDAGSDGIQMAVDLRIVGTFVTEGVEIPTTPTATNPRTTAPMTNRLTRLRGGVSSAMADWYWFAAAACEGASVSTSAIISISIPITGFQ